MPFSQQQLLLQLLPPIHQLPYELEKILLIQMKDCDGPNINKTLNALLEYTLISSKNDQFYMFARITELTSVFTRILIETGASDQLLEHLIELHHQILHPISGYEELCESVQQMTRFLLQHMQAPGHLSCSELAVCQARGYIARHYASRLTLQETADYVHLNPAYFSSIFKKNYGIAFKEFLNRLRIEKSKQLLTETNQEILDIAIATGFEDQSYFTKTFRKYTKQTPKQFRTQFNERMSYSR